MAGVNSTIALGRWDAIVKQTQPVFDDIESGDFTNRDLARVAQLLKKQSKLASTVFEQNLQLLSEQAKTYIPVVKQELAKIGEAVSPKNIGIVVEAIYKELVTSNIKTIVDKIKEVINSDVVKKFQETAKSFYNDYAKFYGKAPIVKVKNDQVVAEHPKADTSKSDGLMQKVYDSLANMGTAIVDLPTDVSTQVAQDLLPKIKESIGDRNIAKDVSGETVEDATVPVPEKLEKKLAKDIDPNYWAKKGFIPWIGKGIKDFLYMKTHTSEEVEQDIKDFVDDLRKKDVNPLALSVPGLDIADEDVRERRRRQAQQDLAAVWGETDEAKAEKIPAWKQLIDSFKETRQELKELKASTKKGFSAVGSTTKSILSKSVSAIASATGAKYLAGVRDLVDGFHDKLEKKVDAIKKFASRTGNIFSTLLTGGILAYVLYNVLLKHIDWGKVGTKIIQAIFPGLNRNEDPSAPENQPDYHSENDPSLDGLRQGYGEDEKGNQVFTVQDEYGKFHNVYKDKDGNITMSTSDDDPRVMQTGPYAGYKVQKQGPLSDIGFEDSGEYTDYVHPETGQVIRHKEFSNGVEVRDEVIDEGKLKDPAFREIYQKRLQEKKEAEEKQRALTGVSVRDAPPEYKVPPKKSTTVPGATYDGTQEEIMRRALAKKDGTGGRTPAVSRPVVQEPVSVKTVTLPNVDTKTATGGLVGTASPLKMYQYDPMNLRTTRANGNKADETLGLLNGRDF